MFTRRTFLQTAALSTLLSGAPGLSKASTASSASNASGASLASNRTAGRLTSDRPAVMTVPFPPGGGADVIARSIAEALAAELGRPVVVSNRPGAGGTLGAQGLSRQKPDGASIGYVTNGILCVNPILYPKTAFDPMTALEPVGRISEIGLIAVFNAGAIPELSGAGALTGAAEATEDSMAERTESAGAHSRADAGDKADERLLQKLLDWARRHPGELRCANSGIGTTSHLAGMLFEEKAGIELMHVPFKGGAAAIVDVLAGRVPLMIDVAPNVLPHVRSGRLAALGAASKERLAAAPEVPTLAEMGLAGVELSAWDGLALPKGAPKEIADAVSDALKRALQRPEVAESLAKKGAEPRPGTAEAFKAWIEEERPKWAALARRAALKA